MESIFSGDRILLFQSVQQGTVKWINCSFCPGVNVYITHLLHEFMKNQRPSLKMSVKSNLHVQSFTRKECVDPSFHA